MHQIDFLTTVIDNYWDMWFAFHLALSLLDQDKNVRIRFFWDDRQLFWKLKWDLTLPNVEYYDVKDFEKSSPSETIYNFFDRKINFEYLHQFSYQIELINFSYFLMHDGVKSLHNTFYNSKNVSVRHYIPSLLPEGGGVIISPYLEAFKKDLAKKGVLYYKKKMIPNLAENIYEKKWISVFCYKETFESIKDFILEDSEYFYLVFDHSWDGKNSINMPFLNICDYEKILSICDANIVRWENSFIAAISSQKPFLWDIYKEHNGAHKEKIQDFIIFLKRFFEDKEYFECFQDFNLSEDKKNALQKLFLYTKEKIFFDLSAYIYQNANLLKKIKK